MNDIHRLIPKLVEIGLGVDDRDSDYRTPLHLAVTSNNY
jgi:ankyrin repeat protein